MRSAAPDQLPPDGGAEPTREAQRRTEEVRPILASVVAELESRDARTNGPVAIGSTGAYKLIGMTDDVSALAAVLAPRRALRT
jgi:hypothetical protein